MCGCRCFFVFCSSAQHHWLHSSIRTDPILHQLLDPTTVIYGIASYRPTVTAKVVTCVCKWPPVLCLWPPTLHNINYLKWARNYFCITPTTLKTHSYSVITFNFVITTLSANHMVTHGRTGHPPYQNWLPNHRFLHMYVLAHEKMVTCVLVSGHFYDVYGHPQFMKKFKKFLNMGHILHPWQNLTHTLSQLVT